VDGGGGFTGELLVDDGLEERGESTAGRDRHWRQRRRWAVGGDERGELRRGAEQVRGGGVVI
tara:strand:- start:217 stop:402 length:186 start_codon:yes stop_codon:yes gene_type:complete